MRQLVLVALLLALAGAARNVSASDLSSAPREHDNTQVLYRGEVIGDILPRGGQVWLNVSDGSGTLGIWAEKTMAECIQTAGDYKHRGDTVEILGRFNRACPEHGGDLDIHASQIRLVSGGGVLTHRPSSVKIVALLVLALTAGALYALTRRLK